MQFRAAEEVSTHVIGELLDLSADAARVIRDFYALYATQAEPRHQEKPDRTPLTQADLASHHILTDGLRERFPDLPVLSEESTKDEIRERHSWTRFWMVDPLDGTREFIDRSGDFTINIALIDDGHPVMGLLYRPLLDTAFVGIVGTGAWRYRRGPAGWEAEAIHTRALGSEEVVVLASRRHRNEKLARTTDFLDESHRVDRRNSGSALKFCDLASGEGDCYPRFSPCSEWDVAAGDALVCAAGGQVLGLDGRPLTYNARETLLSPHFIAVGDPSKALWRRLLQRLQ